MDQIPNIISVVRLFLIVPVAYGILYEHWVFVLVIFGIAGLTDSIDGYVARRFHWTSRFGEIIDPMADKVTFGGTCVLLTLQGFWPGWLLGIVLAREAVILGGAAVYRLWFKHLDVEPTMWSKINTTILVSVIVLVVVAQIDFEYQELAISVVEQFGYWAVALFSIFSGIYYVRLWGQRALIDYKSKKNSSDTSVLP